MKLPKASSVKVSRHRFSVRISRLADELAIIENAGIEIVHLDVMDGHFVPNITFGPPVVAKLRPVSKMCFDAHLMITDPQKYAPAFVDAGVDHITFHAEVVDNPFDLIDQLHKMGVTAGVCINPETPVSVIQPYAAAVDMILVMTVHPGFGGQKFIPEAAAKVKALRQLVGDSVRIEVDGGIDEQTAPIVVGYGADTLVAGNAIFGKKDRIAAINSIKKAFA